MKDQGLYREFIIEKDPKTSLFSSSSLKENSTKIIPYCYIKKDDAEKTLVYFHGNAEDVGYSRVMYFELSEKLNVNIIGIEYPGYGMRAGEGSCSSKKVI